MGFNYKEILILFKKYSKKIKTKNISLLDMEKIDELFNVGYNTAKLKIKEIKKIIK